MVHSSEDIPSSCSAVLAASLRLIAAARSKGEPRWLALARPRGWRLCLREGLNRNSFLLAQSAVPPFRMATLVAQPSDDVDNPLLAWENLFRVNTLGVAGGLIFIFRDAAQ